ncbi:MAG: hypothetical protein FWG45_03515 [Oscillospiraceae bacterium]|nr:hypothetical protein [Oscillospiraceae bacterium]
MKPVLIDRSLVNMEFSDGMTPANTDKRAVFMYVCALAEAGASYVEVDFQSLIRLPKPSGSENYIYRIGAPEEYVVANALKFAYAVLPLKYAHVLPRLELPVILEVDVGDGTDPMLVFDILQLISTHLDLTAFEMIRLTGEFDAQSIPGIVNTYRRRTVIPLDICPRNTTLTALDSAIAAYHAEFDAVTVGYGSDVYASFEEMLIMLASMYRTFISGTYLEGICKASLFKAMFSDFRKTNLSLMMNKYMYCSHSIKNVDFSPYEDAAKARPMPKLPSPSGISHPAGRVLGALGLERETSNEIIRILEECNLEIANNNKKEK